MPDSITLCGTITSFDPDVADPVAAVNAAPTGKPYDWQLPAPETPEILALPLEALASRAFERSEAFRGVLERTAAFLVVISRNNGYEGRDPLLVLDDMQSGTVSSFLGIPLAVLARALLEMQRRGMVAPTDDGTLRIVDLGAVDRLSGGGAVSA